MTTLFPLLKALTSLTATLALMVGLAWAYRRWGTAWGASLHLKAVPMGRLNVQESKRLNAQTTLYVVKIDDKELLLAATGTQVTLLAGLDAPKKGKVAKP